jgi:dTMP kinase
LTLKEKLTGRFIVFDGPDGGGKGTQIALLVERLEAEGLEVVRARDPGGTVIGERVRHVLLGYDLSEMDVRCETLLFMASRAQLVGEVVEPALRAGKTVVCDRFISATCAYQAAAGYDASRVIELGRYAVGDTWPDLTIILDVPTEEGFRRMHPNTAAGAGASPRTAARGSDTQDAASDTAHLDAMEARPQAFHRKVRELFLSLPGSYPGRVEIIDALGTPAEVSARIVETISRVDL